VPQIEKIGKIPYWNGQIHSDFFLDVSRGYIPGHSVVDKFGHNDVVGTSPETIWWQGGIVTFPSAALTMTVSSSSANDTALGTGARTVSVEGLDTNYNEVTIEVTMNGQTGVTIVPDLIRISRMLVLTGGSTGENQGTIYIGSGAIGGGVPAVIYNSIPYDSALGIGENQTLSAFYTVPAQHRLCLYSFYITTPSTKLIEIWLRNRPFGGVFNTKSRDMMTKMASLDRSVSAPLCYPAKSDVILNAAVDSGTTDVSGGFQAILVNEI